MIRNNRSRRQLSHVQNPQYLHLSMTADFMYRVAQNKPSIPAFNQFDENLHKITSLTLVAHRQIKRVEDRTETVFKHECPT